MKGSCWFEELKLSQEALPTSIYISDDVSNLRSIDHVNPYSYGKQLHTHNPHLSDTFVTLVGQES